MTAKYNLPDIEFASKDAATIEAELIASYENTAGYSLTAADPRTKLLQAEVPILVGQRAKIDATGKQNLLAYASEGVLDHIGVLVGCTRIPATAATTTVRFTLSAIRTQPTTIPAGIRVTAGDNVFFAVVAEVIILAGQLSAEVKAQCTSVGAVGNGYAPGVISTVVDPIPYVATVANLDVSAGGTDVESDDAYRDRIQQAPERFSTAGPDGAYIYWAKTASSSIIDVKPMSPSPGVVSIYVLLSGGEIPGTEILDTVLAICSDRKVRPLTDQVVAKAPEIVSYSIDVQYWIDKANESVAASIREAVEKAVAGYMLWQKTALGRDINPTELVYLMRAAGAKRVQVNSPSFLALEDNQVAKETGVAVIAYGGSET